MVLGLFICLTLILWIFGLPVLPSLKLILQGAFEDKFAVSRTVVKTVPLLLTSLGIVVAWRAGMYNVGGEGQFVVGGLAGAWAAKIFAFGTPGLPPGIVLAIILGACIAGGAFYGWLAGLMYTKRGVDIVVSTILLNFVAIQLLGYAVSHPLQEIKHALPQTDVLPDAVMLPKMDRQTDIHLGLPIALAMAVVVHILLFLTRDGFKMRLVGANPRVARANRIDAASMQRRAMLISGGLCGLAGGVEYTAIAGQLGTSFSQNWGFLAIPVALLGGLHPLSVILSASFFGVLFAGSEQLARFTPAGTTLIYVIQAAAVLGFVGISAWLERRPAKQVPA